MVPTSSSSSSSRRHDETGKVGGGAGAIGVGGGGTGGGGTGLGGVGGGGGKGTEEGSSPSWHPQSISTYSKHNPTIKTAGDGGDVEVEVARSKVESADLESDKTVVLRNNDNYNNFNLYSRHITSDNTRKDKNTDNDKDNDNDSDNNMNNNARRVTSPLIRDKDTKQAAGPPYSLTGSFREEKALVSGTFDTTKIRKSGDFSIYSESLSSIGRAGSKSDDKGGGGGGLGYTNIDTLPIVEQKVSFHFILFPRKLSWTRY